MRLEINLTDALKRPREHAYSNFDPSVGGWKMPWPVNPHVHLRDPLTQADIFNLVVPETAKLYAWATAMPNLGKNRIRTPEQAIVYRQAILERAHPTNPRFDVTVPLFLEPDTDPEVIRTGYKAGAWKTAKGYPKNGTTESDFGIDFRNMRTVYPALTVMEELDMLYLVHGEVVLDSHDELVVDRFREKLAIDVIEDILRRYPRMRVVFEHISSRAAVNAYWRWKRKGYRVEATIAPQYLLWNSSVLFERGMNPERFSVPVLKDEEDRSAILEFMLDGGGMLGTDSAPHDITKKSQHSCCPGGLYNEPVGLFVYFHLFRAFGDQDWFEKFKEFAFYRANRFYDVPTSQEAVVITEEGWEVPDTYTNGGATLLPMLRGTVMPYSLKTLKLAV